MTPGEDLTITGMIRSSRGALPSLSAAFFPPSEGDAPDFGSDHEVERTEPTAGDPTRRDWVEVPLPITDGAWHPFRLDLRAPDDAGLLQVYHRLAPPTVGTATVDLDSVRVIQWAPAGTQPSPLHDILLARGETTATIVRDALPGAERWAAEPTLRHLWPMQVDAALSAAPCSMDSFVLAIIPQGSLSSSVITTTRVGVFVVAFFNLRFGWVLSGLVVPGYLVPLLIAKPVSFGVIVVEAIVTYLLVWTFSERLSGGRSWSSVFGRDRFLALVLASVAVRLSFDAWLLPSFGAWLVDRYGLALDLRHDLHSFGLIIIALLANQFWKPGLLRGLASAAVTIGITWLLVRFVLIEFTNFRISEVTYLYEGVASSILASPKSYMILIVTAVIASRMNLRYGWELGGILIPALIALQWYQPVKVLASFAEAFIVLGLATALLRSRLFADVTMEGARKLVLFFNVSFAYKLVLGHALVWAAWDVKVTDYFGFGYLLSTLMAMKMHEKRIAARFSRAVLQVSLIGAAAGTLIGFALRPVRLPDLWPAPAAAPAESLPLVAEAAGPSLPDALVRASLAAYLPHDRDGAPEATPREAWQFRRAVELLLERGSDPSTLARATSLLEPSGFRLSLAEGRYLLLTQAAQGHRGAFVIDTTIREGLSIQVPDPLEAPHLVEAGLALLGGLDARALAIAGTSPSRESSESEGATASFGTYFQAFHEALDSHGTLQLRGAEGDDALLRVDGRIPRALDLPAPRFVVGELRVDFDRGDGINLQRDSARNGFVELVLGRPATLAALAAADRLPAPERFVGASSIDALLLHRMRDGIARAGTKPTGCRGWRSSCISTWRSSRRFSGRSTRPVGQTRRPSPPSTPSRASSTTRSCCNAIPAPAKPRYSCSRPARAIPTAGSGAPTPSAQPPPAPTRSTSPGRSPTWPRSTRASRSMPRSTAAPCSSPAPIRAPAGGSRPTSCALTRPLLSMPW